ncbi:uncharacterized protein [Eurosta solidaginis]|uniref:uncharacterized protein n=1 Tax=Eurosta solidaginis TaxID=178769 RepID=UPI0035307835
MQIAAVNEELCHASPPTSSNLTSHTNGDMTCHQHRQSLNQQHQQCKLQQKYREYSRNEMLKFQFRIVMMPYSLQMRLLLPSNSLLATLILIMVCFVLTPPVCQAVGYSYSRFSGPVTGPEQKVVVNDGLTSGGGGGPRFDYIAKPAYEFAYGVEDAQARLLQSRQEMRDCDTVRGSYSVVDPDGSLRVVKYTADDISGFKAEVTTNGLDTMVHGQQPPSQPYPAPLWNYPHAAQHQVQHPQPDIEQNNYDDNGGKEGDYEVNEDYEENDENESDNEKHVQHKESNDESEESYDNEDEHEDYDGNEHSAEFSKEATSYQKQSEEYN